MKNFFYKSKKDKMGESEMIKAFKRVPSSDLAKYLGEKIFSIANEEDFLSLKPKLIFQILDFTPELKSDFVIEMISSINSYQDVNVFELLSHIRTDNVAVLDNFPAKHQLVLTEDAQTHRIKKLENIVNDQSTKIKAITNKLTRIERLLLEHIRNPSMHGGNTDENDNFELLSKINEISGKLDSHEHQLSKLNESITFMSDTIDQDASLYNLKTASMRVTHEEKPKSSKSNTVDIYQYNGVVITFVSQVKLNHFEDLARLENEIAHNYCYIYNSRLIDSITLDFYNKVDNFTMIIYTFQMKPSDLISTLLKVSGKSRIDYILPMSLNESFKVPLPDSGSVSSTHSSRFAKASSPNKQATSKETVSSHNVSSKSQSQNVSQLSTDASVNNVSASQIQAQSNAQKKNNTSKTYSSQGSSSQKSNKVTSPQRSSVSPQDRAAIVPESSSSRNTSPPVGQKSQSNQTQKRSSSPDYPSTDSSRKTQFGSSSTEQYHTQPSSRDSTPVASSSNVSQTDIAHNKGSLVRFYRCDCSISFLEPVSQSDCKNIQHFNYLQNEAKKSLPGSRFKYTYYVYASKVFSKLETLDAEIFVLFCNSYTPSDEMLDFLLTFKQINIVSRMFPMYFDANMRLIQRVSQLYILSKSLQFKDTVPYTTLSKLNSSILKYKSENSLLAYYTYYVIDSEVYSELYDSFLDRDVDIIFSVYIKPAELLNKLLACDQYDIVSKLLPKYTSNPHSSSFSSKMFLYSPKSIVSKGVLTYSDKKQLKTRLGKFKADNNIIYHWFVVNGQVYRDLPDSMVGQEASIIFSKTYVDGDLVSKLLQCKQKEILYSILPNQINL